MLRGYWKERPGRVWLAIMRVPAWMSRHGLGWVFGDRYLMLTHVGRRSGRRYETALDVIWHDRERDEYIVIAAWGPESNWLANVMTRPPLELCVNRRRIVRPEVRVLDIEERIDALLRYDKRRPLEMKLVGLLWGWDYLDGSFAGWRRLAEEHPMLGLRARLPAEQRDLDRAATGEDSASDMD